MSYDIHLFRTETKEQSQQLNDEHFFGNENNLVPFTQEQYEQLKERLLKYSFTLESTDEDKLTFAHPRYTTEVLLTNRGLYFSSGWDEDSVFEAGMTASEFTDSGEYAKYDPQNGGWEDL